MAPDRTLPNAVRRSAGLQLIELRKRFGDVAAIDGITLEVKAGEFLTLLGSSGSGKSTTLMAVAGFVRPTGGQVLINREDQTHTPPHKRDIGLVFQHYALFPHLSVAKNIGFPLEMRGVGRAEIEEKVAKTLALVRLGGLGERKPSELSGGQAQRVALARALVYEPSILLLDEPLGALDKNLREEMQVEIRRIQQVLGITTISVTHDQHEAITMSDRIAVMREGRIDQVGTPADVYERPATRFVAQFMGATNFVRGVPGPSTDDGRWMEVQTADGAVRVERRARLGDNGPVDIVVRPERLRLSRADQPLVNGWKATVTTVAYTGESWRIGLVLKGGEALMAVQPNNGGTDLEVGQAVNVDFNESAAWAVTPDS